MKFWLFNRELRWRYALAMGAGLLLAASFPRIGVAGLAWVGPGLLLASAAGLPGGAAFRIGYIGGFTHFLASLYWLLHIPVPIAPIVGWLALSAFLALYAGAWVWLCWRIFPGIESGNALQICTSTSWLHRIVWAFACAALWVAWEMVQARFLSGFPWNFLGASQYRMLLLIQMASFTGVYGVSFVVVWTSIILLSATAFFL